MHKRLAEQMRIGDKVRLSKKAITVLGDKGEMTIRVITTVGRIGRFPKFTCEFGNGEQETYTYLLLEPVYDENPSIKS